MLFCLSLRYLFQLPIHIINRSFLYQITHSTKSDDISCLHDNTIAWLSIIVFIIARPLLSALAFQLFDYCISHDNISPWRQFLDNIGDKVSIRFAFISDAYPVFHRLALIYVVVAIDTCNTQQCFYEFLVFFVSIVLFCLRCLSMEFKWLHGVYVIAPSNDNLLYYIKISIRDQMGIYLSDVLYLLVPLNRNELRVKYLEV